MMLLMVFWPLCVFRDLRRDLGPKQIFVDSEEEEDILLAYMRLLQCLSCITRQETKHWKDEE